jgi:hypothetical protein
VGNDSRLASDSVFKLLFSPEDSTHPAIYMQRAIPALDETAALQTMVTEEFGVAVVFRGLREGADDHGYQIARIGDISL